MDYRKTAWEIYDHIGKKENIISAAHCATRLRLVIGDNAKADKEYVENIEGVKGVFFAQGQMQIILGTGVVNKVYDEFIQIAGVSESSKEDLKKVAASRANPVQRLIKTLGDIFVPIIPAIVASGFLMGIMEALNFMVNNGFLNIDTSGSIYTFAQLFSNTAYTFLPILIAYSGAKVFGANPYLGAVLGMIMIHPSPIRARSRSRSLLFNSTSGRSLRLWAANASCRYSLVVLFWESKRMGYFKSSCNLVCTVCTGK